MRKKKIYTCKMAESEGFFCEHFVQYDDTIVRGSLASKSLRMLYLGMYDIVNMIRYPDSVFSRGIENEVDITVRLIETIGQKCSIFLGSEVKNSQILQVYGYIKELLGDSLSEYYSTKYMYLPDSFISDVLTVLLNRQYLCVFIYDQLYERRFGGRYTYEIVDCKKPRGKVYCPPDKIQRAYDLAYAMKQSPQVYTDFEL